MAELQTSRLIPRGTGMTIDVEAIERELADLWRSSGRFDSRGVEVALSRTSVLTLFVYATDAARAEQAKELIDHLSSEHPSRVVLLTGQDPSIPGQEQPAAEVSIQCKLGVAERYAPCYEQIAIALPADGLDLLPSLLIPLALPDLPSFLWWTGPAPLHDRRFTRVARAVDRVILDSLDFARPVHDLVLARRLFEQLKPVDTILSDLNWARIAPWQEMTARVFDLPHCRWALEAITDVWVVSGRYEHLPPNPAQALLFLGWMGSRLGWEFDDAISRPDGWCLCMNDANGQRIEWNICFEPYAARLHGHILSVQFQARRNGEQATFTIARGGLERATVKLSAQNRQQQLLEYAFHHALFDLRRLLVRELQTLAVDPLYEAALAEAEGLARAVEQWLV